MIRSTFHRQTVSLSSLFESLPQRFYHLRNGAITNTTFSSASSCSRLQEVVSNRSFFPRASFSTDLTPSIAEQQIGVVVENDNHDDDNDNRTKDSDGSNGEDWDGYREKRWEHMKQQLIEYREEHGNMLVPLSFEENPKLGIWGELEKLVTNFNDSTLYGGLADPSHAIFALS